MRQHAHIVQKVFMTFTNQTSYKYGMEWDHQCADMIESSFGLGAQPK